MVNCDGENVPKRYCVQKGDHVKIWSMVMVKTCRTTSHQAGCKRSCDFGRGCGHTFFNLFFFKLMGIPF